jgi:hypothetical protein
MDNKATKLLKMLLNCGIAVGEAYSIKYIYESGIKPWYKWNLIAMMSVCCLTDSIRSGLKSIDEFGDALDDKTPVVETPETVEES